MHLFWCPVCDRLVKCQFVDCRGESIHAECKTHGVFTTRYLAQYDRSSPDNQWNNIEANLPRSWPDWDAYSPEEVTAVIEWSNRYLARAEAATRRQVESDLAEAERQ